MRSNVQRVQGGRSIGRMSESKARSGINREINPEVNKETTVNSRNMIRVAVLGLACLAGTTALRAQTAAGSASAGKFGVINVRQGLGGTAEGKTGLAGLNFY